MVRMKPLINKVAEACGCENVIECQAEEADSVMKNALASNKTTIIVCKCDSSNIPVPVIELDAPVIKHPFMEEVKKRNA